MNIISVKQKSFLACLFVFFYAFPFEGCNRRHASKDENIAPKNENTNKAVLNFSPLEPMQADVGATSDQMIVVTNTGSSAATSLNLKLPESFTVQDDTCAAATLEASQSCSFTVAFAPTKEVSETQTFTLSYQDVNDAKSNSIVASVSYQGIAKAILEFSQIKAMKSKLDASVDQIIKITNTGSKPADVLSVNLRAKSKYKYLNIVSNKCKNKKLDPSSNCVLTIRYSPMDPDSGTQPIDLTYRTIDTAQVETISATIQYETNPKKGKPVLGFSKLDNMITFDDVHAVQTIKIINAGTAAAKNIQLDNIHDPLFVMEDNCSNVELARKKECTVLIKLTGNVPHKNQQNLRITYGQDDFETAQLHYEIIKLDPANRLVFDFDPVADTIMTTAVSTPITRTVTVKNTSSAIILLSDDPFILRSNDSLLKISVAEGHGSCPSEVLIPNSNSDSSSKLDPAVKPRDDISPAVKLRDDISSAHDTCTFSLTFEPAQSVPLSKDLIGVRYRMGNDVFTVSHHVGYVTQEDEVVLDPAVKPRDDVAVLDPAVKPRDDVAVLDPAVEPRDDVAVLDPAVKPRDDSALTQN